MLGAGNGNPMGPQKLLGEGADDYTVRTAEIGVIGPIMFYMRPRRHGNGDPFPEIGSDEDFNRFVEQIVTFSIGGIGKLKGE